MTVSQETNEALNILVIPQSDTISLELDDRIILRFTPTNPALTPETYFDETGEFLRDATNLRILDDDSEYCAYIASSRLYYTLSKSIILSTNQPCFYCTCRTCLYLGLYTSLPWQISPPLALSGPSSMAHYRLCG